MNKSKYRNDDIDGNIDKSYSIIKMLHYLQTMVLIA